MAHLDNLARPQGISLSAETPGLRLEEFIDKLYEKHGQKVVILIDEYDMPMLDVLHKPDEAELSWTILGDFYGISKPNGDKLEFLMLTGIFKFSPVSVFPNSTSWKTLP